MEAAPAWAWMRARRQREPRTLGPPPTFLPGPVQAQWVALSDPAADLVTAADPPGAAGRWLGRVAPAPATARGVLLRMHGEIRLGRWRPFRAHQVIGGGGFIWAAEAGRGLSTVKGYDRYSAGSGEMDWRLFGAVPVMRRAGGDVTRSAAGRFAAEMLVLSPFRARSQVVTWIEPEPGTAVAAVAVDGQVHRVTLRFEDGRLLALAIPRWGDPDGEGFREEVFGVSFDGERRFGDFLLPASFTAGWWPGTDRWPEGEFFRCTVDDAAFF